MAEILIVDDERPVRNAMRGILEAEGFEVVLAKNGGEALEKFSSRRPDLVLLDVMMPGKSGIQVCEEMRRADPLVPVIFLSAVPTDTTKVRAFGAGADGYLEKSENPDVIVARIRSALRREEAVAADAAAGRVRLGSVTVDVSLMRVTDGEGRCEGLTRTEAALFAALNMRRGEYVSNDELFSAIHGAGFAGDTSKIRNYVVTLRRKLGSARDMIANNPNAGYRLLK